MKISEFKGLIKEIPCDSQAFDIKQGNWKCDYQQDIIASIFKTETITISRHNLFIDQEDIKRLIIKILMWGYPTKGRGNNIENLLKEERLNSLAITLKSIKNRDVSIKEFQEIRTEHNGLGISKAFGLFFQLMKYEAKPLKSKDRLGKRSLSGACAYFIHSRKKTSGFQRLIFLCSR